MSDKLDWAEREVAIACKKRKKNSIMKKESFLITDAPVTKVH